MTARLHIRLGVGYLDTRAGSAIYSRRMALALAERGHDVSILAFEGDEGVADACRLTLVPFRQIPLPVVWRFSHAALFYGAARFIDRFGRNTSYDDDPDVALISEHAFVRPHARRYPKTPWVYLPHSVHVGDEMARFFADPVQRRIAQTFYEGAQRWALIHSDTTVRFSRPAVDLLRNRYPTGRSVNFTVMPPGVDIPPDVQIRRVTDDACVRVLAIGALQDSKRIGWLLQRMANVGQLGRWHLDIVGDGPERPTLERQAIELGLGRHVTFHGHKTDPTPYYRQSHLMAFPSRQENFPLVVLEALAFGLPVLAMDPSAPGMALLHENAILPDRTGILARDDRAFETQLCDILNTPSLLEGLSAQARAHAEEHFAWETHVDRMEDLLIRLARR